ncbi:MAG: 1-acyl-sn-glycerol-3-phosphate acyltransferase [Oscillospiraceae bacterium]|nr:1-acyl-sn-glycerol-3-phosphate acyltransferase [Oscillospiraceae bacterium]
MKSKHNPFVLGFVKLTAFLPAMLFFKPKVYYMDKIIQGKKLPKPCILMSNHTSLMDFALYLILFPWRTIRFLMAEVLFRKGKLFSWFLRSLGGLYVDRDGMSFDFVEQSLEILEQGGTVGIFPQGRLPVGGKPFPFKPSISYIALRCNAPIVPVYTDGNYGLFKRTHVMIGTPITLPPVEEQDLTKENYERLTRYLEQQEYKLKAELEQRLKK